MAKGVHCTPRTLPRSTCREQNIQLSSKVTYLWVAPANVDEEPVGEIEGSALLVAEEPLRKDDGFIFFVHAHVQT